MELPNLEGQPGWVVVVVFGLFVLGGLGALWLKKRGHDPEDPVEIPAKSDTLALGPGVDKFDPVREAMTFAARQAEKSAEDADKAESEAKQLAAQLSECGKALAILQERYNTIEAQLAACNEQHRRNLGPAS